MMEESYAVVDDDAVDAAAVVGTEEMPEAGSARRTTVF